MCLAHSHLTQVVHSHFLLPSLLSLFFFCGPLGIHIPDGNFAAVQHRRCLHRAAADRQHSNQNGTGMSHFTTFSGTLKAVGLQGSSC